MGNSWAYSRASHKQKGARNHLSWTTYSRYNEIPTQAFNSATLSFATLARDLPAAEHESNEHKKDILDNHGRVRSRVRHEGATARLASKT